MHPRTASTRGCALTARTGIGRSRLMTVASPAAHSTRTYPSGPAGTLSGLPLTFADGSLHHAGTRMASSQEDTAADTSSRQVPSQGYSVSTVIVTVEPSGAFARTVPAAKRCSCTPCELLVATYPCNEAISRARFGGQQAQEYHPSRSARASSDVPSWPVRSCNGLE